MQDKRMVTLDHL